MTLARGTVTAAAPVNPAPARLISGKRLIRAAVHVACWVPFIGSMADSWRGPWRAVGDGARMALVSWATLSARIPLLGQPNELPHAPHDLGPMQYWLLTIPVHVDTDRGVMWGAALLAMLAASLTVEAAYSVLGEMGGLLASGVVIATVAWFPGFAAWPFDNPNFGMMFFLAALSACLAVLSGHRKWWPVLVVTASTAAQAYLTFAAAAVGLVLIAVVAGLADEFRAKGGYSWLIAGLVAGAACWVAPLDQQFTSPAGKGNMSLLLHENGGRHVGLALAMKVMASLAAPSSLWWGQNIGRRHDLYQMLSSKPAAFGLVILAITAASLVTAVCWLRSRELAGLAAIGLLVSVTAVATFALIPAQARGVALPSGQVRGHDLAVHIAGAHRPLTDVPLIFVMFTAALLPWLTVICVTVLAAVKLTSDRPGTAAAAGQRVPGRQQRARQHLIPLLVRGTAALLVVMAVLFAAQQAAFYSGAGTNSLRVSAALAMIERSLPRHPMIALSVSSPRKPNRYQVRIGLDWALTADGYRPHLTRNRLNRLRPTVVVVIRGSRMTVHINQKTMRQED